jgi:hypothetical protein
MCWRPQTSGYSYPRVTSIRIEVHPADEIWPTHHTHLTLSPRWSQTIRISRGQRIATFRVVINRVEQSHCSWHNPQHVDWPICGSVRSFSPKTANEAVGAKSIICWRSATRLTGSLSPACDRYLQYFLAWVNPSVLNHYRHGLQPPKGPVSSLIKLYQRFQSSSLRGLWPPCGFPTTRPSIVTYNYA